MTGELGVLTCRHVADHGERVAFVHHAASGGGWDFLCAEDHSQDGPDSFVIIGVSHLIRVQPDLEGLLDLPPGWSARLTTKGRWIRTQDG